MKPIILRQHEIIHLRDHGSVIAWRVVKDPEIQPWSLRHQEGGASKSEWTPTLLESREWAWVFHGEIGSIFKCPYGRTGEERWVKETWSRDAVTIYPCPVAWYKASDHIEGGSDHYCPPKRSIPYADCLACWEERYGTFRWRSPAIMPRWASRFTVEIEDVSVERIQDVDIDGYLHGDDYPAIRAGFMGLHDSVNGKGSWDRNDYFWKLTCTLKK